MSSWQPPSNYQQRPVAVLGGGVLGRRIGTPHQPLQVATATDDVVSIDLASWRVGRYNS